MNGKFAPRHPKRGIKIDMEQRGKDGFHRVDVGIDFGTFRTNCAIYVAYAITVLS